METLLVLGIAFGGAFAVIGIISAIATGGLAGAAMILGGCLLFGLTLVAAAIERHG